MRHTGPAGPAGPASHPREKLQPQVYVNLLENEKPTIIPYHTNYAYHLFVSLYILYTLRI